MTRLRLVPYRRLRAVGERAGFQWMRSEGSHNIFVSFATPTAESPLSLTTALEFSGVPSCVRSCAIFGMTMDEYNRALDELR